MWERAELVVTLKDAKILHEMLDNETSGSAQGLRAMKYVSVLMVENKGSIAAKTCEVVLERLRFKSTAYPNPQDIDVPGTPVKWSNPFRDAVVIPGMGKSFLTVAEIHSPSSQPVAADEAATAVTHPTLVIGGATPPTQYVNGTFTAVFKIYSENTRPLEVTCVIEWNNKWEQRLTEMSRCVNVEITSKRL